MIFVLNVNDSSILTIFWFVASGASSRLVIFSDTDCVHSTRHSSCSWAFSKFICHRRCQSMILALDTTRHHLMRVHIENRTQMSILLQQKSQKLGFQVSRMFPLQAKTKTAQHMQLVFFSFDSVLHIVPDRIGSPPKKEDTKGVWAVLEPFSSSSPLLLVRRHSESKTRGERTKLSAARVVQLYDAGRKLMHVGHSLASWTICFCWQTGFL